jgi:hypothetical protein
MLLVMCVLVDQLSVALRSRAVSSTSCATNADDFDIGQNGRDVGHLEILEHA